MQDPLEMGAPVPPGVGSTIPQDDPRAVIAEVQGRVPAGDGATASAEPQEAFSL
jgi:hypothetical protein